MHGLPPRGKERERKKNEGYRGLTKAVPVATMCCTLTPDLVGSAVEEAPTGPTRIYYYLSGHFHYEMEEQQREWYSIKKVVLYLVR